MNSATQAPLTGIRVLITGGTIDKVYHAAEGCLGFERTQVLEMLRQGRVPVPEECVQTVVLKDSLDMVDADRAALAAACLAAPEERLLITHGTDTMVQTAQHLAQGVPGRTIVLTGAMVPFSVSQSDADAQLRIRARRGGPAAGGRVCRHERQRLSVECCAEESRGRLVRECGGMTC